MRDIPTFVKWAGGKKQLLEQFKDFFPKKFNSYHEPFVGGGSVALYLLKTQKPSKVYLSDLNSELINCYNVIKNDVEVLIKTLKIWKKGHSKEQYYKVRKKNPKDLDAVSRAARFIYLNRTCFNGLYRENSKGEFNVPMGNYKNPSIVLEKELREISKLLKNTVMKNISFENVLNTAKKGDFIYFDPPYYPLEGKSNFTTYTKEKFLEEEQRKLANIFKKLDKRGCLVMLSNSDTNFVKELYDDYNISIVKAKRMINCDATKRGEINEIVVTNYPLVQANLKIQTERLQKNTHSLLTAHN